MGARQSKRSVDITTGKEAVAVAVEGSEVAASGGEGKLERIEDVDALKPAVQQLTNGDTPHVEEEISDKEKKLAQDESPENEKDNCAEKDIILSPVSPAVNGDSKEPNNDKEQQQAETVEAKTNKKNKKEKTKKKFSFRSISFSKKDKQKPAKKEEAAAAATNGECEKVPEEVADASAPAAGETKAEVAAVNDAPKVEEAGKTPETPVTEPITNGDSAPESPKEEIKQNGDSASIESAPAAPAKEEVPEPPKPVESPESLPIDSLKIEDATEPEAESKTEEANTPEKEIEAPAPIETEVCVAKAEAPEAVEAVPPPLPANPPPSSLTIFAESTMAPHLINQQVVSDRPAVDVGASLSSDPSSSPVAENVQNAISETIQPVCENKSVDTAPPALPTEEVKVADILPAEASDTTVSNEALSTPLENAAPVIPDQIENIAVVSSNECDLPKPDVPSLNESIEKIPEVPVEAALPSAENLPSPIVDAAPIAEVSVSETATEPRAAVSNIDNVDTSSAPLEPEVALASDEKPSQEVPINLEITSCANIDILPQLTDINNSESPVPQGSPSEPDISETGFVEPSDSFPPPPPPVSCPESITEISASESLPPPLSESSQQDNGLNSPTSEILEFPPKDLPSPVKENGDVKDCIEPENLKVKLLNGNHNGETAVPSPQEVAPETTPVEESQKIPSTDVSQAKTVSDIIENAIVDTVVDSIPAENCVVAAE